MLLKNPYLFDWPIRILMQVTECKDSKYLDASGACVDSCPDGYYESGTGVTGRTCVACRRAVTGHVHHCGIHRTRDAHDMMQSTCSVQPTGQRAGSTSERSRRISQADSANSAQSWAGWLRQLWGRVEWGFDTSVHGALPTNTTVPLAETAGRPVSVTVSWR